MTLARGTDRLESARLVLRRVAWDDLPFFTRLHALPEVAQHLYPNGRPRSPEETAAWLRYTLASYEQLALGYLAVLRKEDGALIGRCGLMDLVVESAAPEHEIRRGWFGRENAPAGSSASTSTCAPSARARSSLNGLAAAHEKTTQSSPSPAAPQASAIA